METGDIESYIEFIYSPADVRPGFTTDHEPVGGGSVLPEWYTGLEAFADVPDESSSTVKLCRPFSDALRLGFIIRAPGNMTIERTASGDLRIVDGSEFGVVHGSTPHESRGNSRKPFPEITLDIPWRINSPDQYSSLVTKPLNREVMVPGLYTHSMMVPTDTYSGPVQIPVTVTRDTVTIEEGDPLAQVIPLNRDRLPSTVQTLSNADDMTEWNRYERTGKRISSVPSVYRNVYWKKKPVSTVVDAQSTGDGDFTHAVSDIPRSEPAPGQGSDGVIRLMTREKNYGVIPEPTHASDYAPPWAGEITDWLTTGDRSRREAEQLNEWVSAACSLGIISPTHAPLKISQSSESELTHSSTVDTNVINDFPKESVGSDYPEPVALPNMLSEWVMDMPSGYSNLYVEPFSHQQQYYRASAGIVDDDEYRDSINTPGMWITRKASVTLEPREAVSQIIPIHRDSIIGTAVIRNGN